MNFLKETEKDLRWLMLEVERLKLELHTLMSDYEKEHKNLLLSILEVLDSLEEKLQSAEIEEESLSEETKKWISKFRMPYKKLQRLLNEEKVVPIEVNIGEFVNPVWHLPVDIVRKEGVPEDSISEVLKKGYLLKGKLLRNSEVTIVKNNS